MKKLVKIVTAVAAIGGMNIAQAQSTTTKPATGTVSAAAPAPSAVSWYIETRTYPEQNSDGVTNSQIDILMTYKLNSRHKIIPLIDSMTFNHNAENAAGAKVDSFDAGTFALRHQYLLSNPEDKTTGVKLETTYLAPTTKAWQDSKMDGALNVRMPITQSVKLAGGNSILFMVRPFFTKYLIQNAEWTTDAPVNDMQLGSLFLISLSVGKFYFEPDINVRVTFPARDPEATEGAITVKTIAESEAYLGYNITDSFSAFLLYQSAKAFAAADGYELNVSEASADTYSAGIRASF